MSLSTSLLAAVTGHRCFTGCYKADPATSMCVNSSQPLAPTLQAVCNECLAFRVGALTSTLGAAATAQTFADDLSAHVRGVRGYVWSTSLYSATGGFWVSAAYYGNGLFLVDASRNGNQFTDLDVLIHAFRQGVITPEDPQMLSSSLYTAELVYLDMSQPTGPVHDKQSLLVSTACRKTPSLHYQRASVLEFLPMTLNATAKRTSSAWPPPIVRSSAPPTVRSATGAASSSSAASSTPAGARRSPGGRITPPASASASASHADGGASTDCCPFCGAEIKERPLFTGTFVGCLC